MDKYGMSSREMSYLPVKTLKKMRKVPELTRTTAIAILLLVILVSLFIRWSEANTKKAEAAYGSYETCVMNTYGVTATEFYQVYGHVAKCK